MTSTVVAAQGTASRRDVVVMMVLDRSGSMNSGSGSCGDLKAAAKLFTGQFAANRDRIGMLSFSDGIYLHSAPTVDFKSQLGYDDGTSVGSGNGAAAIDSIACDGGTGTPAAISVAYNELKKINLPGALNVLLIETDGLPNTLALRFGWDSATNATAIVGSGCQDANGKSRSFGGWNTSAAQRQWLGSHALGGSLGTVASGAYASLFSQDPNQPGGVFLYGMINPWSPDAHQGFTLTGSDDSTVPDAVAPGCLFDGSNKVYHANMGDINWIPATDIFGNSLNPATDRYKSVTTDASGHIAFSSLGATPQWQNYHDGALNATIDAAYRARTDAMIPATVFVIGLGGNDPNYTPDYTLLQRLANDPGGDAFNSPSLYNSCATQLGCVNYTDQPKGTFIFSADKTELRSSFLRLSSQILRLSK
jgi:hypothetical protein